MLLYILSKGHVEGRKDKKKHICMYLSYTHVTYFSLSLFFPLMIGNYIYISSLINDTNKALIKASVQNMFIFGNVHLRQMLSMNP